MTTHCDCTHPHSHHGPNGCTLCTCQGTEVWQTWRLSRQWWRPTQAGAIQLCAALQTIMPTDITTWRPTRLGYRVEHHIPSECGMAR